MSSLIKYAACHHTSGNMDKAADYVEVMKRTAFAGGDSDRLEEELEAFYARWGKDDG